MPRFSRRKWGWYLTLIARKHFKVKLLWFKKAGCCSKQYHNSRNELWLLLKGAGVLNRRRLVAGDSHVVLKKKIHQFTAIKPSLVLEIQYGEKCSEDDIVRL